MQEIIDLLKQPNFWLLALIMSAIFFIFWGISKLPKYKKCTGEECKSFTKNRTTENLPLCDNCIEKMKVAVKAKEEEVQKTKKEKLEKEEEAVRRTTDELCIMGGH